MAASRNFQLQGSYTRYYDGLKAGYGSQTGARKCRNYKTLEAAIKAANAELNNNELPKVAKIEIEDYIDVFGRKQREIHAFAEDGHEFSYSEEYEWWHVDAMRVVDRTTQNILWES